MINYFALTVTEMGIR